MAKRARRAPRKLVFTFDAGEGDLRLKSFVDQLKAVQHLLEVERDRSGAAVHFEIRNISRTNPYRLEVIERPDAEKAEVSVFAQLSGDLGALKRAKPGAVGHAIQSSDEELRWDTIDALVDLGSQLGKTLRSIHIGRAVVGPELIEKLKQAVLPARHLMGSITGRLDAVNVHGNTVFWVYPTLGPKKVKCIMQREGDPRIRRTVLASLEKYVTVRGRLLYRQGAQFPYAIDAVREVETHEPSRGATMLDLEGLAPGLLGDLDAVTYLRRARGW